MARFEARQQANIYPRTPDPQVLGIDLLSLVLGKNPLLPSPTSTTSDDIPNNTPVTTTVVTKLPVTTTVITTGNDGQPTTVIRTTTQTIVFPTTTNGNDHINNPAVATNTAPKHGTTTPPGPGSIINGGIATSNSQNPSNVVAGGGTALSESSSGVALKASLAASKECASRCDPHFGTTGVRTGPPGSSPTGGTTDDGPDRRGSKDTNLGALIGGIVGAIVGAALLMLAIYFLVRRARRRRATANNTDDATGLLTDGDPFKSIYPPRNRESRMAIETRQLQRSPSFGTLYGLTYNPDVARGSVLSVRNSQSPSTPVTPIQWKPFTPSVPRSESDTTEVHRHSEVGNRLSAGRPLGVALPKADHRSTLSTAAVAENPFTDPVDHGNESASRETIDVTQTPSHLGSDYSDPNC